MTSPQLWTAFITIARKEVVRIFRIWKQTLLPPIITQSLYFVIFGAFIGSRVGEVGGLPYMQFIVPGIVMMSVINTSYMNTVFAFFSAKWQRNLEEIMVSPTPHWVMLAGYVSGGVVRGLVTGTIVLGVSLFFTHLAVAHIWAVILFALLTSLVFSLGGFLNAIFAKSFDDTGLFSTFILTPLTYLGGIFYAVSALPEPWRTISAFNPIVYMVDGFRYGLTGTNDFSPWTSIIFLVVVSVVLTSVILQLLKRGIGMKK